MVEVVCVDEPLPNLDVVLVTQDQSALLLVQKIISSTLLYAVIIDNKKPLYINQVLKNSNQSFMVPIGTKAKGYVFNIQGEILNAEKETQFDKIAMNSIVSSNHNYAFDYQKLETGIKVIDFFTPILKGFKIGIFGGAGVGKTILMKEIILNLSQKTPKTTSIFIGSGERSREAVELYYDLKASQLMDNTLMFIAQMNENAGSRMYIIPFGISCAEYFRDVAKENVLLFVDNIFRFLQAGNEISASLNKKPSLGGYQPTLNTDVSAIQDRLYANENGAITSFQTVFLPMDDFNDPSAVAVFQHLNVHLVLSRAITAQNIFPALDPLASSSIAIDPDIIGQEHFQVIGQTKQILQKYKELEDLILILGVQELDYQNQIIVKKALQLQNFFSQNFFMTQSFTQECGVFVPLQDTIAGVKRIINGDFLDIAPEKFLYLNSIADLTKR